MYSGKWPTTSFTGQPLRPSHVEESLYKGLRFRLVEVRGDWKAHQSTWGLNKAAFTSNNVCHICRASRTDPRYSMLDFAEEPGWAQSTRTHLEFLNEVMSTRGCNLIYVAGFHYAMIRWCSMHSVQLGVGLFCNGGCFYELMKMGWFSGNTPAERYRSAFRKFKSFINSHGVECSQPTFKPWMYVSSGEESCTFRSKVLCLQWYIRI